MRRLTKKYNRRGDGCLYLKRGVWYLQYYVEGVRRKESLGTKDKAEAERLRRERAVQRDRGEIVAVRQTVTVADLYKALRSHTENNARRRHAVRDLENYWNHLEPTFGKLAPAKVTTAVIEGHKQRRRAAGAAPATINRELANLRRMFNYGKKEHQPPLVQVVPHIRLFSEKGNERKGFVEPPVFARMASVAAGPAVTADEGPWLRAFIECAYTYGWRKSELIGLSVRQCNLAAREIRLDAGTTKNGDGRVCEMTDAVHDLLAPLLEGKRPDEAVFTRRDGSPVRDFRDAWWNLCIEAGAPGSDGLPSRFQCGKCGEGMGAHVKKCKYGGLRKYVGLLVHDMRRSAARNLRRAGVSEGTIMQTGGWRTRSMLDRYNIQNRLDQREAMDALTLYRQQFDHPEWPTATEVIQ
ncbi:MAG: tyrosine-type recombinase/integrase, partial [Trebonia sp.]